MRKLDLFEIVDSDRVVVALPGQPNLDEVGHQAQFPDLAGTVLHYQPQGLVRLSGTLATGDIKPVPDAFGHGRKREMVEGPAHVATGIAVLQAAGQNLVEGCSRNRAELTRFRDGLCQPPVGHARAHSALDYLRIVSHLAPI